MCRHCSFVFDADGNPVAPTVWQTDTNQEGKWLNQITFINKQVEVVINDILSKSETPPIIILQGDHGFRFYSLDDPMEERLRRSFEELNALYLPAGGNAAVYESISSINTFRVIFNFYFDANLELLPDDSYYPPSFDNFFSLVDVTRQF